MAYNFTSPPGAGLNHIIPLQYDVGSFTLVAEFASYPNFSPLLLSKPVSGSGRQASLTLTASEVDALQSCYYRIRGSNRGVSKTFQTGQMTYLTPTIETAMMTTINEGGLIKDELLPARLSDTALKDIPGYLNVKSYGAKGDGVADDTAAINTALNATGEGQILFFPKGTYLISSPLILRRNRTLMGTHAGRWPYHTGGPCRLRATSGFTGEAMVMLRDEEDLYGSVGAAANGQYSGPNDQNGMRISRLTIDGFNVAAGGIKASGLIRDVRLTEVAVRRCTGNGIHTVGYTRTDTLQYFPRGWALHQVVCDSNGNNGFAFNLLNDSTLVDCLSVNSTVYGFYIAGPGELLILGSRSVFNKSHGFYITGSNYGNLVLSGCSTDRNTHHGIYIDATGRKPILLSGVVLRRDGGNNNGGGGGYAALCVNNSNCPIVVSGMTSETGVDDVGAGAWTPQYGLKVTGSTAVVIAAGVVWGRDGAYNDGGGNTTVKLASGVITATGTTLSPTLTVTP